MKTHLLAAHATDCQVHRSALLLNIGALREGVRQLFLDWRQTNFLLALVDRGLVIVTHIGAQSPADAGAGGVACRPLRCTFKVKMGAGQQS